MPEFWGGGGYGPGFWGAKDTGAVETRPEALALAEYYTNLLILQYISKPKARATIKALTLAAIANDVYSLVRDGFDIETAVGKQLDFLAAYVGASRTIFGLDLTKGYFSFAFAEDSDPVVAALPGFAFAEDESVTDYFLSVPDTEVPSYAMNDEELRFLIKFRAATQGKNLTVKEIDDVLYEFFGDQVSLTDNGDMTIIYIKAPSYTLSFFGILAGTNSLPKPAGVQIVIA